MTISTWKKVALGLILLISFLITVNCDDSTNENKSKKLRTIEKIQNILEKRYINEDIAKKMSQKLGKIKNKLAKTEDPVAFARKLSKYLLDISNDKHLYVDFSPGMVKGILESKKAPDDFTDDDKKREKAFDYGFFNVQILPENVGYIQMIQFCGTEEAYKKAAEVMEKVENCDAVIVDFRSGRGGFPKMVQFLSSYFLPKNPPTLLESLYVREGDTKKDVFTFNDLPGKRLDKADLYILTSQTTFSAQESFAYIMKHLNRAVIIGEKTSGGANGYEFDVIDDEYFIAIPIETCINPITKTNWEAKGIEPDVKTDYSEAILKAYDLALEKISKKSESINSDLIEKLDYNWWAKRDIDGKYGDKYKIYDLGGRLYFDEMQGEDVFTNQLLHKKDNTFALLFNNTIDKIEVNFDKNKKVKSITIKKRNADEELTYNKL